MKVLEVAMKANQRLQFMRLGTDCNKDEISNTLPHASACPNGHEAWTMRETQ